MHLTLSTRLGCSGVLLGALVVVVGMACVVRAGSDDIALTPERCKILYNGESPFQRIEPLEKCSLCRQIVRNRYMWTGWGAHLDALCTGVPSHLRDWCQYYVCKLRECSDFAAGSCMVSKGGGSESDDSKLLQLTPCPDKYLCYACLEKELSDVNDPRCLDSWYLR